MKKCFTVFFVVAFFTTFGQHEMPSKEDQACFFSRLQISEPPYGLNKIRNHLAAHYGSADKLATKFYQSLPLRQKFTYHMIHGESFMQNCSIEVPFKNGQHMLFAQLPRSVFGEYRWSEAQYQFFKKNWDSVIFLIKQTMAATGRAGLNFKAVITDINAKELAGPLLDLYLGAKTKDRDILTVLTLLMKDNSYPPFLTSALYKKLYGPSSNYSTCILFNKVDEALIIEQARKFYSDAVK